MWFFRLKIIKISNIFPLFKCRKLMGRKFCLRWTPRALCLVLLPSFVPCVRWTKHLLLRTPSSSEDHDFATQQWHLASRILLHLTSNSKKVNLLLLTFSRDPKGRDLTDIGFSYTAVEWSDRIVQFKFRALLNVKKTRPSSLHVSINGIRNS